MARLGLGNMLAVDEERRERAQREISWVPRFLEGLSSILLSAME